MQTSDESVASRISDRVEMLEGVESSELENSLEGNGVADIGVWLESGGSACGVEEVILGIRGVKKVEIFK